VAVIRPESALSPKGAPIQCQLMSATGAFWSPPGVLLASSTLVRLLMQNARRHHPFAAHIYTHMGALIAGERRAVQWDKGVHSGGPGQCATHNCVDCTDDKT